LTIATGAGRRDRIQLLDEIVALVRAAHAEIMAVYAGRRGPRTG
jgi:hypothetical protein